MSIMSIAIRDPIISYIGWQNLHDACMHALHCSTQAFKGLGNEETNIQWSEHIGTPLELATHGPIEHNRTKDPNKQMETNHIIPQDLYLN